MISQTLTARQLRGWLERHGVTDANRRIRATADAGKCGYVTVYRGQRFLVNRLAVGGHVYYTVDERPARPLLVA